MRISALRCIVWITQVIVTVNATYFVQLKKPSTLEKLLSSDDNIKAVHHIRPFVEKAVSFGNFEGFSANFTKDVLQRLVKNPYVASVVPDQVVNAFEIHNSHGELDQFGDAKFNSLFYDKEFETQVDAPRHLSRISRNGKLPFNETTNYYFDKDFTGEDVYAYIVDTGIFKEHPDFENRVIDGHDFTDEGLGDFNGHGTHVAGIVGSKTYGVAKSVNLVELKALDKRGQGSLTTVLSALEYAVKDRKEKNAKGVVNLSLGALKTSILNDAVEAAVESGLVVVVAAGNSNIDACITSPASSPAAITIGALDDRTDNIAAFSNYGKCVDIFASGYYVQSLSNEDIDISVPLTGTSMASPSATGLAAILLSAGIAPENVGTELSKMATTGKIPRRSLLVNPWSPNRILSNGVKHEDDVYPDSSFFLDSDEEPTPDRIQELPKEDMDPQRVGGLSTKEADSKNPMAFKL